MNITSQYSLTLSPLSLTTLDQAIWGVNGVLQKAIALYDSADATKALDTKRQECANQINAALDMLLVASSSGSANASSFSDWSPDMVGRIALNMHYWQKCLERLPWLPTESLTEAKLSFTQIAGHIGVEYNAGSGGKTSEEAEGGRMDDTCYEEPWEPSEEGEGKKEFWEHPTEQWEYEGDVEGGDLEAVIEKEEQKVATEGDYSDEDDSGQKNEETEDQGQGQDETENEESEEEEEEEGEKEEINGNKSSQTPDITNPFGLNATGNFLESQTDEENQRSFDAAGDFLLGTEHVTGYTTLPQTPIRTSRQTPGTPGTIKKPYHYIPLASVRPTPTIKKPIFPKPQFTTPSLPNSFRRAAALPIFNANLHVRNVPKCTACSGTKWEPDGYDCFRSKVVSCIVSCFRCVMHHKKCEQTLEKDPSEADILSISSGSEDERESPTPRQKRKRGTSSSAQVEIDVDGNEVFIISSGSEDDYVMAMPKKRRRGES